MRIVVDTNVLISGLLWRGAPHQLIEQARRDAFALLSSAALLAEFDQVIRRPKFRTVLVRSRTDRRRLLQQLRQLAELVEVPAVRRRVSRDPDDDHVLALAVAARADLIVTGDDDLLSLHEHAGIRVVTPAEALRLILAQA